MTGFGSGRAESAAVGSVGVELRSVNSRFLDLIVRLPGDLSALDPVVRGELQARFVRGKIAAEVRFEPVPGAAEAYEVNEALLDRLVSVCHARGSDPRIETLMAVPGVVSMRSGGDILEAVRPLVEQALAGAMDALLAERSREGNALCAGLKELAAGLRAHIDAIERFRPFVVEKYRRKLEERLEELLGPRRATLDPGRIEQEVALFADKADISEEVLRLRTHVDRLEELLSPNTTGARGRALDFLQQEILREINTVGSKARDLDIASVVLQLKNDVETLKEQIANIE